ncbi:MAG: 50S ribosomal protein L15 [Nitrospirae bacterium]|nr:MAG: 50S ribosomal protein L15 [Nitrospirota bacterium]
MRLNELSPAKGSNRKSKRVGRGPGSGHGKTSCRGHKGQKARSGGAKGPGFEGGQMPLQRRLPKRGFRNIFKKEYAVINIKQLALMETSDQITPESILKRGLVSKMKDGIKLLGEGDIDRAVHVKVHAISSSAKEKIEKAGGTVELITHQ